MSRHLHPAGATSSPPSIERVTSLDGTALAARRAGRGTPIVLVHGALGSLDSFGEVEPLLAERHEVWVYSWRGHEGSGETDDHRLARQIEDLLAVIARAGGDVHLCGWSTGAVYALAAAGHASSLRSLILYEPPLKLDDDLLDRMLADLDGALAVGDVDAAVERFLPYAGVTAAEAAHLRGRPEVWQQLRNGVLVMPHELRATRERPAPSADVQTPQVPTLYLRGAETESPSFLTPAEVAAIFPHAEIVALPRQRHLAPVFDPRRFAGQVLRFTHAVDSLSAA